MSTPPDQTISDAASSLGRSSSIDARDGALPRSDSQRRSASSKTSRKGTRSGNDLFVCFAPRTTLNLVTANRPVVSPARDKGKESGSARRSGRTQSASMFANKGPSKKQGFEVSEEPTSPKVTCIGQVRSKSKRDKKGKASPSTSGSRKSGEKESACPGFGKDFSCFGMPCDSYGSFPSFRGDKKSNGTVFAKSLVLIQKEDEGQVPAPHATNMQLHKEEKCGALSSTEKPRRAEDKTSEPISVARVVNHIPISAPDAVAVKSEVSAKLETSGNKEMSDEQSTIDDEDDTFEAEPMLRKVERLRVVVPPPSLNITLKRSTSAPAHCRRKSQGEDNGELQGVADDTEHGLSTDKKLVMEGPKVLISSEDLPKPTTNNGAKSFLQRCKSVSRSLSRNSSGRAEETKASPAQAAAKVVPEAPNDADDLTDELHMVKEALSRRRSDSEALKVSMDIVPETWLLEARAIGRQEANEARSTGSGRRLDKKRVGGASDWLDGELEAALWRSCQVASATCQVPGSHGKDISGATEPSPMLQEEASQSLDAEVEATLWRCCSLVASHSAHDVQPVSEAMEPEKTVEGRKVEEEDDDGDATNFDEQMATPVSTDKDLHPKITNLGRSSSVGSQGRRHGVEQGFSLRRSASVGAGHQQQRNHGSCRIDTKKLIECTGEDNKRNKKNPLEISDGRSASCSKINVDHAANVAETELWCEDEQVQDSYPSSETSGSKQKPELASGLCNNDTSEKQAGMDTEEAVETEDDMATGPSPSSVLDRPAPPPSPAPATPPEAVLVLHYDLSAYGISLDTTSKMEPTATEDQQRAMLEAISHLNIHDVQRTFTRLLKAASGKERASLTSAVFRLQRCKSEPVKLASY